MLLLIFEMYLLQSIYSEFRREEDFAMFKLCLLLVCSLILGLSDMKFRNITLLAIIIGAAVALA